jgi:hypothetical protein
MYEKFNHYSQDGLHNAAQTHLAQLTGVNDPKGKNPLSLPNSSHTCVKATDAWNVALNYASPIIQGMIAADLPHVEGLLEEAWHRAEKAEELPIKHINTYVELERQTRLFLDFLRGPAAPLTIRELADTIDETSRALSLIR